jgi:hypothetical protein
MSRFVLIACTLFALASRSLPAHAQVPAAPPAAPAPAPAPASAASGQPQPPASGPAPPAEPIKPAKSGSDLGEGEVHIKASDIAVPPGTPLDVQNKQDALSPDGAQVARNRRKMLLIDRAVSQAAVDQDENTKGSLAQIHAQYQIVRRLFGGEHAILTAGAYLGQRCNKDSNGAHSFLHTAGCVRETRSGVAGLIIVPLWGFGGGHGKNFWPVVQTDDEVQTFLQFQQSVQLHGEALAAAFAVFDDSTQTAEGAAGLSARVAAFRDSLKEELQREVDMKGGHRQLAQKFLQCLAQIEAAKLGLQLEWDTLNRLWNEYHGILDNSDNIMRRHNLLVGPFIGVPITEDPTKVITYGLGAELGREGFRLTLGGGLTADYSAAVVPITGWIATIGLSGQWGDDLLHYLSGAKDLANGIKKVSAP